MAKVPTATRGKAYPKSSSDGFMSRGSGQTKMGATSAEKLGRQLVEDPNFYDASRWVVGTGWTVGFGKAVGVPATSSAVTQLGALLEDGESYRVDVEMTSSAGAVTIELTGGTDTVSAPISADASFILVAQTGNANIAIRKDIAFDGELTRLSVRKITT